jgi:hypothetical protein
MYTVYTLGIKANVLKILLWVKIPFWSHIILISSNVSWRLARMNWEGC